MSKKIIITGGLGYISAELLKYILGTAGTKITVFDNQFISERVKQIRDWNMDFIHGDILDKNLVRKHFDVDVVHHLAGITKVPRTKNGLMKNKMQKLKMLEYKV